jgi:hypothetical protein
MQKFHRTLATLLLVTVLFGMGTQFAQAKNRDNENESRGKGHKSITLPFRMRLQIAMSGKASLVGTVESVSGTTFRINSWGGVWTVTTDSNTKFGKNESVAQFTVGDSVKVEGKVSTTTTLAILAKKIENKNIRNNGTHTGTSSPATTTPVTTEVRIGTVTSVGSTTLDIRQSNGKTSIFTITSLTRFFNSQLQSISQSQILTGHNVAAYGTTTNSSSLNVVVIHDLSL